ncbi:LPXTG cell wall anchor domain-containing protein [Planococcus sp. APC 4015]|nr:LPXTG cell wall anchor domain-containing protein [Planococcus sp. APC 4015]
MRRRLFAIGLAAVLGAAAGAASVAPASAVTVPLDADFGVVMPGESAETSTVLEVPVASVVTVAEWSIATGSGVWGARLCSPSSCTELEELTGTSIAAGSYRVEMSVTMPTDAVGTGATAASGRISLMEAADFPLTDGAGLAVTGGTLSWIAVVAGAAAVGGGAGLLLRRRRADDEEASR